MDPHLCVGIDIGYRNHRVGTAAPHGAILDEFDIPSPLQTSRRSTVLKPAASESLSVMVMLMTRGSSGYPAQ